NLDEIPSIKTLHKIFYSELRELGFRAHHAKQIYLYAKAVVRSSKRNNGKKPVLRKLTARLDRANRSSNFNKKLSLWFYRKIQFTISYEALERRLLVSYVNPMNTLSKCPRCGSRLKDSSGRIMRCSRCGFVGDRDIIACINLFYRYLRCGV
ncbi:MAG: zinc ribbon domain-containing protein, partial [Sulfolobales archaeon]